MQTRDYCNVFRLTLIMTRKLAQSVFGFEFETHYIMYKHFLARVFGETTTGKQIIKHRKPVTLDN